MTQTRFSQRLAALMKERKISGQKIGDAIGKSQKTISRYANGEVDPSNEIKNAIYRVIADISGIEEDAMTEELLEQEWFGDWAKDVMNNSECGEWKLVVEAENENGNRLENLKSSFEQLSLGAKQYYIKYLEKFHLLEDWEYEVVDVFHKLSSKKQTELVEYLEHFDFTYKKLNCTKKMATYMEMIENSKECPVLIKDNGEFIKTKENDSTIKEEWLEKIVAMMYQNTGYIPYVPCFLTYTPYDWYFLFRLQIFELYDREFKVCWGEEHGGVCLGNKLMHLLESITEET